MPGDQAAGGAFRNGGFVTEAGITTDSQGAFTVIPGVQAWPETAGTASLVSETQRLQMLNEISRALSARLDLRDVYDTVYEQISRVMDTSMFFLALPHREKDRAQIAYVREFGELTLDFASPPGRSVTTHVIELGQPLLFLTTAQYERYALSHGLPVIILGDESRGAAESMIFAPLNTGEETIGTLSVQSTRKHAYSQTDFDTLTVIAAQAAIAVQNGRLYQASVESVRRRQALLRAAETVNSSLELSTVLNAILDSIREVIPYHLAAILLPNLKAQRLEAVGSVGDLSDQRRKRLNIPMGGGVTGRVFESGAHMVVPDVRAEKDYIMGSPRTRSEIAVPLKRGEIVVGVLNVERTEVNDFPNEDVELLSMFATQAAIAIENARLFESQRKRVQELQTLQIIVGEMTGLHQYDAMAAMVERGLSRLIDFDECIIYMVNDESQKLEPVSISTAKKSNVPRKARRLGQGLSGWVWEHKESTIFASSHSDPRASADMRALPLELCVMGSPLMHQGKVTGVVTVGKEAVGFYDENNLRVLEIIASHAAIGFDRCRLYEELKLQAITDDLTGLNNRRYLLDRLSEEKSRALRNGHPLAALLIDADDFKSINDNYGHDAGDAALRGLADLLRRELRAEDIIARYGGEEFLVLLPEVTLEGAVAVAERLGRIIASSRLTQDARLRHIEVSIGVSLLEKGDLTEEIITRADLAMYEAKKSGGNRVCLAKSGTYTLSGGEENDDFEPAA
jgi:diguanylate cyclase (GGDEF)-like protein